MTLLFWNLCILTRNSVFIYNSPDISFSFFFLLITLETYLNIISNKIDLCFWVYSPYTHFCLSKSHTYSFYLPLSSFCIVRNNKLFSVRLSHATHDFTELYKILLPHLFYGLNSPSLSFQIQKSLISLGILPRTLFLVLLNVKYSKLYEKLYACIYIIKCTL